MVSWLDFLKVDLLALRMVDWWVSLKVNEMVVEMVSDMVVEMVHETVFHVVVTLAGLKGIETDCD